MRVHPEPGRSVFQAFPEWMKVGFYILATVATAAFLYGMFRKVRKYRRGAPAARWDRLPGRLWSALLGVAASRTVGRGDRYVGLAHGLIAWGWMALLAGTATIMIDEDLIGQLWPERKFLHGSFYLGYSLTLDLLGAAFIAGLVMMGVRRRRGGVRLDYTRVDRPAGQYDRRRWGREDRLFLMAMLGIALAGFLIEAVRIAQSYPPWEIWSPLGWLVGHVLGALGIGPGNAGAWHMALWWVHAVLALGLVALIPYTKAQHMLVSFAALTFRDPLAARQLPPAQARPDRDYAGIKGVADLNWAELLMLDACTRCGRCHEVCPARGGGAPLSPRDLVLDLREWSDVQDGMPPGRLSFAAPPANGATALAGGVIPADSLWSCTTCRACVEVCPAGVEHVPMIVGMRRRLVEEGDMDDNLQGVLMKLSRQGNSFGQPGRMRARWTQGLEPPVPDARREPVDYLWFVGDFASYDPRLTEVTRTVARVFRQAGVDFGILYDGERNAGNDVRRVGEEGLFELLAEHNISQFQSAQFRRIVTTDPHSYNTLRFEYPALGARYEVQHYTEVLDELLQSGRLVVQEPLRQRVTYHDPCYLGRYGGVFDAPRQVLRRLGCEVVEMPRCRENSLCCGAGGGRIWSGDSLYQGEKPAESRIREALALGNVDTFVVTCPKDLAMYTDAVKTTGSEGRIRVADIIQLAAAATAAEPAAAARN